MNKITKILSLYRSMIEKKEDIYVFGSWWGNKFADNPKYLYLYFLEHGKNVIWITKNNIIYKELLDKGYPVAMADSEKGVTCCRKAKAVFYCTSLADVNEYNIGNAVLINLWHGVPLKKIMYDDKINSTHTTIKSYLWSILTAIPYRKKYISATSETFAKIYSKAFRVDRDQILLWGQPRNDCFFNNMLKKKQYATVEYNRIVLYMPTHRNEGKVEMKLESIFDLEKLEMFCAKHNLLFIIKKHYYHCGEITDLTHYPHIIDFTQDYYDTQELLFNADMLITDYSSCYIDYLLLDRPIIFYAYDYDSYLKNDREMYFDYFNITPGPKVFDFKALIEKMAYLVNESTEWIEQYRNIKEIFYNSKTDGEVSPLIFNEINNINR